MPAAMGRLAFWGWLQSTLRSVMSLKIYTAELARQKQMNPAIALAKVRITSSEGPSSFLPKIIAAKTNTFLLQCVGLSSVIKFFIV